jgi:hypothetical protein
MNNNPQRECSEDPNIHTYGEYTRCLNSKLSNPYTVGFEVTPPLSIKDILMYMGIGVAVAIILLIIYFSVKLKISPIDLVKYFF